MVSVSVILWRVSVSVILWREIVDGGILVEVVGGVGFAFGGGTVSHLAYARGRMYSDVVVGIGKVVCGNQFIADVVAVAQRRPRRGVPLFDFHTPVPVNTMYLCYHIPRIVVKAILNSLSENVSLL